MQSVKIQILLSLTLGAVALFSTACTPRSRGTDTQLSAMMGGKEVIPSRPYRKKSISSSADTAQVNRSPKRAQKLHPPGDLEIEKESLPIKKMVETLPQDSDTPVDEPDNAKAIVVSQDSTNRIINSNGRDVEIKSDNSVIVISGGCGTLLLTGANNQVQCDSADEVDVVGHNNTVVVGVVGSGLIAGNQNALSWGSGLKGFDPNVRSTGLDNTMERLE